MKEQNKNSAAASELNVVPFKTKALPYMIVAPALIITIGIMIPFVMAIYYSLTNFSFRMPTYSFVGLRNWTQILASKEFLKATWVTIKYAFFSTAIEMGLGMGVAIILNNLNNRFSKIMRVALILPADGCTCNSYNHLAVDAEQLRWYYRKILEHLWYCRIPLGSKSEDCTYEQQL